MMRKPPLSRLTARPVKSLIAQPNLPRMGRLTAQRNQLKAEQKRPARKTSLLKKLRLKTLQK